MSSISTFLPTPPNNFSTTLSSGISSSDLTINLNLVEGLGSEGVGVIYTKDTDGKPILSTIEFIHWTGVGANSLTLTDTGDRGISGSASGAQAHSSGSVFEVWVHSQYYNGPRVAFLVGHNQNGAHTTDTISEKTANAGVTIDGVLIKDSLDVSGIVDKSSTQSLTGAKTFKKTVQTWNTANDGETVTFDLSLGNLQRVTLGGNRTLAVSNVSVGQCFIIRLSQDGTGSRTVTWFDTIKWTGGSAPTLTTTANKADTFGFVCTSENNFDGYVVGQNL